VGSFLPLKGESVETPQVLRYGRVYLLPVSLLKDAEAVYKALLQRSPQDERELMEATGLNSERLQIAVVWLELRGRADRHFDLDDQPPYSFSSVSVRTPAWHPDRRAPRHPSKGA
jgi:hypothetical protein